MKQDTKQALIMLSGLISGIVVCVIPVWLLKESSYLIPFLICYFIFCFYASFGMEQLIRRIYKKK